MKQLLILFIVLVPVVVLAQNTGKKPVAPGQKTVLQTNWGNWKGTGAPASFLKSLIDSVIHVTDNKGNKYAIDGFEFTYRQKEEFTNDETGKREVFFHTVQHKTTGSLLPEFWRNIIRERLKKDETIWFEKVIVKGKDGMLQLAPSLEIKVQ